MRNILSVVAILAMASMSCVSPNYVRSNNQRTTLLYDPALEEVRDTLLIYQTLDMYVINEVTRKIVNIHVDAHKTTKDSIFLFGTSIDFNKSEKQHFIAQLSTNDLREFYIEPVGFWQQDLLITYRSKFQADSYPDSLKKYFSTNSPFRITGLGVITHQNGLLKTYSGRLHDKKGNYASFYGMTDPFPLIILVVAGVVAVCDAITDRAYKNGYRQGQCDSQCKIAGKGNAKVVHNANTSGYHCECF